jgi:hypothetical protein
MAQVVAEVAAPSSGSILLWQTSTGVSPDPLPAAASGGTTSVYQAGTFNDPVKIEIQNIDSTNPCYLGGSSVAGPSTGIALVAGAILERSVVGNDSEYVTGDGHTVDVIVKVSRQ